MSKLIKQVHSMSGPIYKLTYFPIRGLAEQTRLLLHDQCIPFEDKQVNHDQWALLKPTMHFGQMPCLHDGNVQIVQSGAIMRHLARKHDLYGVTEHDRTFADMVFDGVKDMHIKYSHLIYDEYVKEEYYEKKKDEFITSYLPVELAKFEKLLEGKGKKGFVLGDKISFVDYFLYEELNIMQILNGKSLDAFPTLKAYHDRMHVRPKLQNYLKARKLAKLPVNNNGKE